MSIIPVLEKLLYLSGVVREEKVEGKDQFFIAYVLYFLSIYNHYYQCCTLLIDSFIIIWLPIFCLKNIHLKIDH